MRLIIGDVTENQSYFEQMFGMKETDYYNDKVLLDEPIEEFYSRIFNTAPCQRYQKPVYDEVIMNLGMVLGRGICLFAPTIRWAVLGRRFPGAEARYWLYPGTVRLFRHPAQRNFRSRRYAQQ